MRIRLHARKQGVLRALLARVVERGRHRAARPRALRALPGGGRRADRADQGARAHGRRPDPRGRHPDQQDIRHAVRPGRHLPARRRDRRRLRLRRRDGGQPRLLGRDRGAAGRARPGGRDPAGDDPPRRGGPAAARLQGLEPAADRAPLARGRGRPPVPERRRRALPLGRRPA